VTRRVGFRRSYVAQKFEAARLGQGVHRRLMSMFGEVVVKRLAYGARGEESVFSLDGDLNLAEGDSHGLRERLAFEVARGSFDEAVLAIETTIAARVAQASGGEVGGEGEPKLRSLLSASRKPGTGGHPGPL
jgi:hypothetical protein